MIPDQQIPHQDILNFVNAGTARNEVVDGDNGKVLVSVEDPKNIGYMTHNINSIWYGDFVSEAENLLNLVDQAIYNMCKPAADRLKQYFMGICRAWDYGMYAKSSESKRDGNNAQTTFVDKFVKNKQERIVTLKDEARKGLMKGMGFDKDDEKD